MKKNLLKLSLFILLSFIVVSPNMLSAAIDPATGLQMQTLQEFNEQQRNSLAGQAAASSLQVCINLEGLGNIICRIHRILNSIIPVLLALGLIYFIWGVVKYMIGGDEESKKKGKEHIVYGIIGLAVIVGIWGLVYIVVNTFGFGGQATPPLPTVPGSSGSCISVTVKPKLQNLLDYATCIISSSVIPLIFALALAMFIWGVVQFVINSSEEAKKEKGRQFMIWGIIALTVMVSVWGLVNILGSTFGIDTGFLPQVKSVAR